jgi:hypothetical protein
MPGGTAHRREIPAHHAGDGVSGIRNRLLPPLGHVLRQRSGYSRGLRGGTRRRGLTCKSRRMAPEGKQRRSSWPIA